MDFGEITVAFIVRFAGVLVSQGSPGWVAIVLAGGFILALLSLNLVIRRQTRALAFLKENLAKAGRGAEFARRIPEVDAALSQARNRGEEYEAVGTAWGEYRETHIIDDSDGAPVIRNAVRPSVFFNLEDLGFGPGWLRILPNMFVAVGLFLTFLGLIAALTQFQERIGPSGTLAPEEMAGFLGIASAKFIMSLTGLACSILFTIALRRSVTRVELALRQVNEAIEDGLSFLSHEDIALRLLREQSQTRSMLQGLATDIATQISQSLSGNIGSAIRDGLAPLIERVQAQSSEGIGAMVASLSERLSGDVGRALSEASGRLELAAERLMQLADRLAASGAAASRQLEASGEKMSTRLDTAVGSLADAISKLEAKIGEAGQRAKEAVEAEAEDMLSGVRDRLLSPFATLVERINEAADAALAAGRGLSDAAAGVQTGAAAAKLAAASFGEAASGFTAAAHPVAEAVGKIEKSNLAVKAAADRLAQTAAESARAAQTALSAAETTLAARAQAVEAVLARLREITDRLKGQGEAMDRIDQSLGRALDRYTAEVQAALDQLQQHVQRLQAGLAPALDTLREVVEQAEAFRPTPPGAHR